MGLEILRRKRQKKNETDSFKGATSQEIKLIRKSTSSNRFITILNAFS